MTQQSAKKLRHGINYASLKLSTKSKFGVQPVCVFMNLTWYIDFYRTKMFLICQGMLHNHVCKEGDVETVPEDHSHRRLCLKCHNCCGWNWAKNMHFCLQLPEQAWFCSNPVSTQIILIWTAVNPALRHALKQMRVFLTSCHLMERQGKSFRTPFFKTVTQIFK